MDELPQTKGQKITNSTSSLNSEVRLQIGPDSELNFARLMQLNSCYEAMPTSSKMVVLDTNLQLRKAFNGLIYQNTRHVLLSGADQTSKIVGILSVTDFIRVLLRFYKSKRIPDNEKSSMETLNEANTDDSHNKDESAIGREVEIKKPEIESPEESIGTLTISEYRELIKSEGVLMDLVSIGAEDSLLKAAQLLSIHRIHRLPVMDPTDGSPLFILTHKRILRFLWLFGQALSAPYHHNKSCKEIGVGTYTGIRVVYPDTSLALCLDILLNKGVSGVPVIERKTYKVVDMYSRFDAIGIALEDKIGDLDVTVEEALAFRNSIRHQKDRVVSINSTDSLWTAITILVEKRIHRLCVLKDSGVIEGLISLSDVINFMVVKPAEKLMAESPHHSRVIKQSSLLPLQEGHELVTVEDVSSAPEIHVFDRKDKEIVDVEGAAANLGNRLAMVSMH